MHKPIISFLMPLIILSSNLFIYPAKTDFTKEEFAQNESTTIESPWHVSTKWAEEASLKVWAQHSSFSVAAFMAVRALYEHSTFNTNKPASFATIFSQSLVIATTVLTSNVLGACIAYQIVPRKKAGHLGGGLGCMTGLYALTKVIPKEFSIKSYLLMGLMGSLYTALFDTAEIRYQLFFH